MDITDFIIQTIPVSLDYDGTPLQFGQLQLAENIAYRTALSPDGKVRAILRFNVYDTYATEWQLELKNLSDTNTAILDNIRFCDITLEPPEMPPLVARQYPRLHYAYGSNAAFDDFHPMISEITRWRFELSSRDGRSSSDTMPYFNLQLGNADGAFLAIGWSGGWKADITPVIKNRSFKASVSLIRSRFYLKPGEDLTLPSMLFVPWHIDNPGGDCQRAFTYFRRFMREYIAFRRDGKLAEGKICLRAWGGFTPEIHTKRFANIKKFNLPGDVYAIDAGWNGRPGCHSSNHFVDIWATLVGDWTPQPDLFPEGLGKLAREARDTAGLGFSAWFECERAAKNSLAIQQHPEYYLTHHGTPKPDDDANLLNLGDPYARRFLEDAITERIEETDMTLLRIDFNIPPLPVWTANDEPDREGITEILYINGLYKLLDSLLWRFPKLTIDNCASGGRRLDYQMCRRSLPNMCRSDYFCNGCFEFQPLGTQLATLALSRYLPLHADSYGSCSGVWSSEPRLCQDTYFFRSSIGSGVGIPIPDRDLSPAEGEWYRKMLTDAYRLRPYMALDFFPLTGYTTSLAEWCAYQLFDNTHGVIFAFRRDESADASRTFALEAIDPNASYTLEDLDGLPLPTTVLSGQDLQQGLTVQIPERRSSRVIFYTKAILPLRH